MANTQRSSNLPPLTAIERIGPKGYLRYVFPFELAEDYNLDEVVRILTAGYNEAKEHIAALNCEAVPDLKWKQAGVLKLQSLPDGAIQDILVKDLRDTDAFQQSYSQLKSINFPVSAFDDELLCRRSVWPTPGERLPVSLLQANFIRGGLILTWCILHMFGDGKSFHVWSKIWAEGCRRAQNLDIPEPYVLDDAVFADRERVMKPSGRNHGLPENHPEYVILPFTPQGAPLKMLSRENRGQVFYFSPERLAALKNDAAPGNAKHASDVKWISTNDAVSALLWRTVMAMQSPLESLDGDPVSVFNIAIDGRQRADPPLHPETLGCFLEYIAVSCPIREILSSDNVADLAVSIRKAVIRADGQFTDDLVTLIDRLEDVDRLIPTAFLDVPGYNCVQSSWATFDLYTLDWGPALGGRIQAVRSPSVGIINGLQVVMPPPPEGGMEILVSVEASCLEKLLTEPLWMKYAIPR
ncbi:hypothetical protein UA08_07781 [Talaromyces atroroseus]|uniref:Trichothecene 3-O-acetyltransferase-like N-terminal domain-containing protein n=1 Tax=Talaromyces atroroseus TaxID=1441469 RepID=A0A225APU7_TALAT|nr:hypothetical protein UA08_07781 [Talaromyces atroroseus]OKL56976.1 hypothetical protein UA08_07781 [Talaromyces atroroseus]